MNIELKKAGESDIKFVFSLQLLPSTRKYARNSEVPTLIDHTIWMSQRLKEKHPFYIIQLDDIDVGVIRLELLTDNQYEISIFIHDNYFGKKIAFFAMSKLIEIHTEYSLFATILPENKASNRLFKSLGFTYVYENTYGYNMKKNKYIEIDGRKIGLDYPPYIIAELSANHNGDINRAYAIMEAAKEAGADAIKLQTYTHETITMDGDSEDFQIKGGLWDGQTLYELYKDAHMPWEWHKPLFAKAKELGITIFSSPFDFTAVDLLENLDSPAYKIASFEVVDLPLVARVAQTGKPMIISTGMANASEIKDAVDTAKSNGCNDLIVLQCVSGYPAPAEEYNLRTIPDITNRFDVLSGLSDHTIDNATAIASVALGACLIEKHVTLDRNGGGADDSFSLEPKELKQLCDDSKTAWASLGQISYERTEAEKGNIKFRRSLYIVKDMKEGELLTPANVRSIRPGFGLAPKELNNVLGKTINRAVSRGTPLSFEYIT